MSNVLDAPALSKELRHYPGQWVAIRANHVIADAPTLKRLLAIGTVKRTDTRFKVPKAHPA